MQMNMQISKSMQLMSVILLLQLAYDFYTMEGDTNGAEILVIDNALNFAVWKNSTKMN